MTPEFYKWVNDKDVNYPDDPLLSDDAAFWICTFMDQVNLEFKLDLCGTYEDALHHLLKRFGLDVEEK